MTALDEKALDRAWEAFGNTPIDIHGDTDDEQRKCLANGIRAYLTALSQSPVGELVTFLNEAAGYFDRRDTGGEDRAHWANVFNAENCRKAATALLSLQAENERLKGQLRESEDLRMDQWIKLCDERESVAAAERRADAAESKAEGFVMVPVAVWDAQLGFIRLYATQLRQDGYETPDGRNLLANRLDGVAEYLSDAAAPSDKVVKVESMGKAK